MLRLRVRAKLAGDQVVAHPYRLQPSLGVTAHEQARFALYGELFLWTLDSGSREIEREMDRVVGDKEPDEAAGILLAAIERMKQGERSRAHAEMLKNSVTFEEWAKNAPQSLSEGVDVEFIKKQIKGA